MEQHDFLYVKGPGLRRLTPTSAAGWRQFALALAATLVLALAPIAIAHRYPFAPVAGAVIGLGVMLLSVRSAIARAQVVDLRSIGRDWADFQAWRDRAGRR